MLQIDAQITERLAEVLWLTGLVRLADHKKAAEKAAHVIRATSANGNGVRAAHEAVLGIARGVFANHTQRFVGDCRGLGELAAHKYWKNALVMAYRHTKDISNARPTVIKKLLQQVASSRNWPLRCAGRRPAPSPAAPVYPCELYLR